AFAWRRRDRELVGQPLGAGQAETEPAAGGVAILHGQCYVCNSRAFAFEGETHAAPHAVDDDFDRRAPAAAMVDGVAGELARRRHQLGLIHEAEAALDRALTHGLTHDDDVVVPGERKRFRSQRRAHSATDAASSSIPFSTSSAVRTPSSDLPS